LSASDAEAEATLLLNDIAAAGGTEKAVLAEDAGGLTIVLDSIVSKILTSNTSFSAPTVSINAFNRTQNLNDLYMAVFATELTRKWEGNVKKYAIKAVGSDFSIVDYRGIEAVGAKGFFTEDSQSIWYKSADGALAPLGGAAALIPDPEADADVPRRILTDNDAGSLVPLRTFASGLSTTDAKDMFELGALPDDDAVVAAEVSKLVEWLYGQDTYDEYPPRVDDDGKRIDGNGVTAERKQLMGDPLHSRPAVVVYGAKGADGKPDPNDAVVYITTNEGLLHAIDARTGKEKWAFAPKDLLYRLDFLRNFSSETSLKDRTSKLFYGLDGTVRVLRIDRDKDGPIEASREDRVFIYIGMRRGGSSYFALDVTNPDAPQLMWQFDLPDGAQSWSNPTVGSDIRSNIAGATYGVHGTFNNGLAKNRFVALIGGGFDPSNDAMGFARDDKGKRIYMLDAADGKILWSAGPSDATPTPKLLLDRMQHSIVSDIRALDLSVDGFIDRIYASDLGGQVWRLDVVDGSSAANLVMGGVMASIGGEEDPDVDRRFYYAPDVSEINCNGSVFYNVAIGSGDRENPVTDKSVQNTFFSFRDYFQRARVETANYKSTCPEPEAGEVLSPCFETIVDDPDSLIDVTSPATMAEYPTVGGGSTGWKLDLIQSAVDGEKALAESRTFAGKVYYTTYSPEPPPAGDGEPLECGKTVGVNRLYVVSACDARPVTHYATATGEPLSLEDRFKTLKQDSIAPEVVFVFPTPPASCKTRDCMPPPHCLVGLETCGSGGLNRPVRTYWRQRGAE
jgi:type IV pilus assembly protein PilY1